MYSYDDGELSLSKTLEYALSAGPYSFNANDFNGLSKDEASKKAADLKARNARLNGTLITISFTNGTSSSVGSGKVFDCSASKNNISCKVNGESSGGTTTGKTATIPDTYLNMKEADFLTKVKALGFSNFAKSSTTYFSENYPAGNVYSYDDGTFDLGRTINYALSAGKYSFNADEFNGISKEDATNKANAYKNRKADRGNLSISFTNGESNSSNAGKTYGCSYTYKNISCKVYTSGGSTPSVANGTILNLGLLKTNYKGNSYDETKNGIVDYLKAQGFTNISVESITSTDPIYSIYSITVNGANHSGNSDYPVGSTIVVTIVSKNP